LLISSFDPIIAPDSTILILGSMPGMESLRRGQYYAHPRNLFWRIMGDLVGVPAGAAYPERVAHLAQAGIALWDSLKYCVRSGSLDADIVTGTEDPNDFATLLADHPGIRAIGFNGKKSEQVFRQQVLPTIPAAVVARLALIGLPSTSPANAGLTYEQKLARWRVILDYLPGEKNG
jgi:TDG/mug DNA glycosylase family protein